MRRPASLDEEVQGFSARVLRLIETGQPAKIQVGFGRTRDRALTPNPHGRPA
ncbi:MAG TPA: hypothetical protein VGM32_06335 [Rhodopila sp.]